MWPLSNIIWPLSNIILNLHDIFCLIMGASLSDTCQPKIIEMMTRLFTSSLIYLYKLYRNQSMWDINIDRDIFKVFPDDIHFHLPSIQLF